MLGIFSYQIIYYLKYNHYKMLSLSGGVRQYKVSIMQVRPYISFSFFIIKLKYTAISFSIKIYFPNKL